MKQNFREFIGWATDIKFLEKVGKPGIEYRKINIEESVLLKDNISEKFKFLAVGGICFLFTIATNFFLKWTFLSSHPASAMLLSVVLASVLSYYLNKYWTFKKDEKSIFEFLLFMIISGVGALINSAPVYFSRYILGFEYPDVSLLFQETSDFIAGPIVGTLLAMLFRWFMMKVVIFKKDNHL